MLLYRRQYTLFVYLLIIMLFILKANFDFYYFITIIITNNGLINIHAIFYYSNVVLLGTTLIYVQCTYYINTYIKNTLLI